MNYPPHRFRIACLFAVTLAAGCTVAVDGPADVGDPAGVEEVPIARCRGSIESDDPQAGLVRIQPVYPSGADDCPSSADAKVSSSSKAATTVVNARLTPVDPPEPEGP